MGIHSGTKPFLPISVLFILLSPATGFSAPGRPRVISCRSPEKETFTCWWEPGDDGGLPTTYALYYRLEGSETVYECPDYKTAGENTCFFSKNDTSLWVNYNITVVASNTMGKSISEPVEVDVVYIVQPNTPESVIAAVLEDDHGPYLRVLWEKPQTADTRSGWITLVYQLRVKQTKEEMWEEYDAGMQKYYNIFSLHSGKEYMVQVRCKPDHGFWSEWTTPVYIQMPDYMPRERSMWIMVAVISAFLVLIFAWTMSVKRNSVKHCLLPPVPGPKIRGFDQQLLKSGKSEEMFNALVIQGFPPTNTYEDLLVEYLEVYDDEKRELVLNEKNLPEGSMKSKSTSSDNDSGRGSCDSRTLLMEKCTEAVDESGTEQELSQYGEASWASSDSEGRDNPASPGLEDGKVQMWPSVFSSPQPHHFQQQHPGGIRASHRSVPEISSTSPRVQTSCGQQNQLEDFQFSKPGLYRYAQMHSMDSIENKHVPQVPQSQSAEYVEVQTVNQENVLLVRPLANPEGHNPELSDFGGEDYSKVRDVTSDNVLLLQRDLSVSQCVGDYCLDQSGQVDPCYFQQQQEQTCKLTAHLHHPSSMLQDDMRLAGNGYVDTTMMMS
ncbi:prolactin receptor a [Salminus brasiliensis]|uniref:prolactin receptor a n=1 Tax=Salminus brasiliensis TaxID=930266 RepID=UPI003B8313B4